MKTLFILGILLLHMSVDANEKGNGGDTVKNPESQTRTLLDLAETDDMVPVLLSEERYDKDLSKYLNGHLLTREENPHFEYYDYDAAFGKSFAFTYFLTTAAGKDWEPCKINEDGLKESLKKCAYYHGTKDFISFLRKTKLKAQPLKWFFTTVDLEDIKDEGAIRMEDPTSKKQVAIQKDGVVVINETEFKKMDDRSKTALLFHERVIYAVVNLNPQLIKNQGTAPIRTFVRRIIREIDGFKGRTEPVLPDWVLESFLALGIN